MSAFDQLADNYDLYFSHTQLGQYYREQVQQQMLNYWPGGKHILEINAGTGEDALFLASHGNKVLATDLSPKMVEQIDNKKQQYKINTRTLAIEDLNQLKGQTFDGLLSNFGGLNCVKELDSFVNDAQALLKPNGILIITLMGRWVPWEWGYFAARGQFSKAFRRTGGKAQWRDLTIYYPRLGHVKKQLNRHFKPLHQQGLGIVMPPSYVSDTVARWPRLFGFLAKLENRVACWPGLSHLADHYVLTYQKKPEKKSQKKDNHD